MRTNNKITLRVGSYNIKAGSLVGFDMSKLAAEIESHRLEIVGLQEVDHGTARSGGIDTMKLLAGAAVYGHYKFARAIYYRGGEYGTGILSRYPIASFEVIPLYSGSAEGRSVGHAVVEANGASIDFFNTHLSYESAELRRVQFAQLAELTKKCGTYVLTGDFNTAECREFSVFENSILVNINAYPTFPSSCRGIDNIVLSDNWRLTASGMGAPGNSDHNLLWAEIELL